MNTAEPKKTGMANGSQMRITPQEIDLIKRTYGSNEPLLKLLRKMFLPEIDPNAPIGQLIDLWMTVKIDEMSPEEAMVNLKARNALITHIDQVLFQLSTIAKQETETTEELKAKLTKNSSK